MYLVFTQPIFKFTFGVLILALAAVQFIQGCDVGEECCNCRYKPECSGFSGTCPRGCADSSPLGHGWGGQWCHIGNLAYDRTATQSTSSNSSYAAVAVDGDVSPESHDCVTLTATRGEDAWWNVDLGKMSHVHNVTIYFTQPISAFSARVGVDVDVSSHSVCGSHENGAADSTLTLGCSGELMGRYVSVQLSPDVTAGYNQTLTFCEVVVMGYQIHDCPAGYKPTPGCAEPCDDYRFGRWCSGTCNCANYVWEVCDKETGACSSGCKDGYTSLNCSVKENGQVTRVPINASVAPDAAQRATIVYAVAGSVLAFSLIPCVAFIVYKICNKTVDQQKEEILHDTQPAEDHMEFFLADVEKINKGFQMHVIEETDYPQPMIELRDSGTFDDVNTDGLADIEDHLRWTQIGKSKKSARF